ncbi:MAG TPA: DUF2301 domain-containing membrane protein [Nitrospirota bacterium]|nr:DUF2301 domain-containing membrane protein [Nitrospirota bacterium]
MGYKQEFQPLTKEDKITVVLYRVGIVLSTVIITDLAFHLWKTSSNSGTTFISQSTDVLGYGLYIAVGLSVFFIHLYVGKFKEYLKSLYIISVGCLFVLLYAGRGSLSNVLAHTSYSPLLLLPLSGCLGFVTVKEAFCFRLFEGYLVAMIMPIYLLLVSSNILTSRGVSYGLVLIAAMLVIFTLRKVFMPIAYDIGDKSAYK